VGSVTKKGFAVTRSHRLRLFAVAIVLLAVAAPAAQAGPLVRTVPPASCTTQVLERPFIRWLDIFTYTLVPDGGLERGAAGWSRAGSSVISGNESYYVRSRADTRSLRLPPGSSATTPAMCVGLGHPTLRLFARSTGSLLSLLRVEVLFEDPLGRVRSLPLGVVTAGSTWRPTLPMPVVANLLPLLPGRKTAVAFRFTPAGSGTWQIDDLYVDPNRRS
jgi:hypothetical protein